MAENEGEKIYMLKQEDMTESLGERGCKNI